MHDLPSAGRLMCRLRKGERMPKRRRLFILALALVILAGIARAEFSPGFSVLKESYQGGQAYSLEITAGVKAWPDLAEASLGAMQAWLDASGLSLTFREREGQAEGSALLKNRGLPLFQLLTRPAEMRLEVKNSLSARYIGTMQSPPWEKLLGVKTNFPDAGEAQAAWGELVALALPLLAPYGETLTKSVTVKNAGRGVTQVVYQMTAEESQALWQEALGELLPILDRLLAYLPQRDTISRALLAIAFTRTLTVKRFLTAEGKDLGLQITGEVDLLGKARRLTLYGGLSETGLYLSLKLPASRGTDTLALQVSLAFSPGRLIGDLRLETLNGKEGLTLSGKADFLSEAEEGGEHISGALTLREAHKGQLRYTVNYTLNPDFIISGGALTGTLAFVQTEGKENLRDLSFSFSLQPAAWPDVQPALSEMDLSRAGEEEIALAQSQIRAAFVPAIREFLFTLLMETRLLVLHDWGRIQRTEGDSVPPLPEGTEAFTVTDSDDLYDTKEETP
jgi:hypothetical protein